MAIVYIGVSFKPMNLDENQGFLRFVVMYIYTLYNYL